MYYPLIMESTLEKLHQSLKKQNISIQKLSTWYRIRDKSGVYDINSTTSTLVASVLKSHWLEIKSLQNYSKELIILFLDNLGYMS